MFIGSGMVFFFPVVVQVPFIIFYTIFKFNLTSFSKARRHLALIIEELISSYPLLIGPFYVSLDVFQILSDYKPHNRLFCKLKYSYFKGIHKPFM